MKKNRTTSMRILEFLFPYRLRVVVSLLLAFIVVITTLYLPILLGRAVDVIVGIGDVDFVILIPLLVRMVIVMCVTSVAQWVMGYINHTIAYHVVRDLRDLAFKKLMRLPVSYIDSHSHGDVLNRIINDVDQFSEGLLLGFAQTFTSILTIIFTLIILFFINPIIALVVLFVTPISIFVAGFIAKNSYRYFRSQSEKRAILTGIVNEGIDGLSTIKAFVTEDMTEANFRKADEELREASLLAVFFSSIAFPSTRFVNSLVYAGVGLSGALLAIGGGISVGGLTSALSYAKSYTKPFNDISSVVTELQNSIACATRVFALLDEKEIPEDVLDALEIIQARGEVEIEELDFSYEKGKRLLTNINLHVSRGAHVAIVGPTGSGKSTLINLLMRFYDVDAGAIRIDQTDIREMKRASLRANFGMVLQETWLKAATVRENIAMGRPDATFEEIQRVAKEAYADGFIKRLPNGYDTYITEGGENLSAGQRQLLCIARVLLTLPPMLILDEATSSIDTMTEARIAAAFDQMMKGRTSFIVAHRLSTIKNADVILVLKDGNIIEQGRHEELLLARGFYATLYNSQFEGMCQIQ